MKGFATLLLLFVAPAIASSTDNIEMNFGPRSIPISTSTPLRDYCSWGLFITINKLRVGMGISEHLSM